MPTGFGAAIPQEPFDQGLEYAITLEGPDSQEDRGRVRREPRHTHKSDTDSHSFEEEGRGSRKKRKGPWLRREMADALGAGVMKGTESPHRRRSGWA